MTKFDLEDIKEIIIVMRNHPERHKNIQIVDEMITALGDYGINTLEIKKLPIICSSIDLPSNGNDHLLYENMDIKYDNYSVIKDEKVYILFRKLFWEAKQLLQDREYEKLSDLMDTVHNIPYLIMDNDLSIPYEIIKKRRFPNKRGYGKKFLKNYREYILKHYGE